MCVKKLGSGYIDSEISEEFILEKLEIESAFSESVLYRIANFGHIIPPVKRLSVFGHCPYLPISYDNVRNVSKCSVDKS